MQQSVPCIFPYVSGYRLLRHTIVYHFGFRFKSYNRFSAQMAKLGNAIPLYMGYDQKNPCPVPLGILNQVPRQGAFLLIQFQLPAFVHLTDTRAKEINYKITGSCNMRPLWTRTIPWNSPLREPREKYGKTSCLLSHRANV